MIINEDERHSGQAGIARLIQQKNQIIVITSTI